jgi:AraC family transcriptional regulator
MSLDELATAAAVSTGHLCRIFRSTYGLAPITAIELLRLARAATLLSQSDLPIGAIARSCGFADANHFSHRFRRVYDDPPGRYRLADNAVDPSAPLAAAGLLPLAGRLLR